MSEEYTQLKDIKLKDILDLPHDSFRDSCITQLLACGFINKVERTYRRGQHFKYDGTEYVLSCFSQQAALVNIRSGSSWSGLHTIENSDHITQAEFDVLCSSAGPKAFQLVEA